MKTGLQRLSAVWWGLWGLVGAIVIVAALVGGGAHPWGGAGIGAAIVACAYALHRVTCWVIAGFFAPTS
jgi:hypothetical protein